MNDSLDTRRPTRRLEEVGEPCQLIIFSGGYTVSGSGQFVASTRQIVGAYPSSPGPGSLPTQNAGGSFLVYIPPNTSGYNIAVNANGHYIAIGST